MSFTVVYAIATVATLAVISGWNWAGMRANRRDHEDVSGRLGALERMVDNLYDRLIGRPGRDPEA